MAEAVALASAIASLVTLVGQVSKLSYQFLSDIKHASKSQKSYLQETAALTEVLLRIEDALEVKEVIAFSHSSQLKYTLEECRDLLTSLKISLERAAEGGGRIAKLKSSLKWPFDERDVRNTVDRLRRYRLGSSCYIIH